MRPIRKPGPYIEGYCRECYGKLVICSSCSGQCCSECASVEFETEEAMGQGSHTVKKRLCYDCACDEAIRQMEADEPGCLPEWANNDKVFCDEEGRPLDWREEARHRKWVKESVRATLVANAEADKRS